MPITKRAAQVVRGFMLDPGGMHRKMTRGERRPSSLAGPSMPTWVSVRRLSLAIPASLKNTLQQAYSESRRWVDEGADLVILSLEARDVSRPPNGPT